MNDRREEIAVREITFIIKPVGATCNLACDYCYYREAASKGNVVVMSAAVLSKFVSEYMALPQRRAVFIWHGGEPLLTGNGFFVRKPIAGTQSRSLRYNCH